MCVCVRAKGTYTVRARELKLGTELGLHPEKVIATMGAG